MNIPGVWKQMDEWKNQMGDVFSRWMPRRLAEDNDRDMWNWFNEAATAPTLDIEETDNEIRVRAEMPGLEKDQFHVEVNSDNLILRGEKKQHCEKNEQNIHRMECSYGSFYRSVRLPAEVIGNKATAEYKNGVLEIHLPKSEESKRRRIPIQVH